MLKTLRPVRTTAWRPRQAHEVLPDMPSAYGGFLPGARRCLAVALGIDASDCQQERWPNSSYCYYHKKVHLRQLEPESPLYPAWPLPRDGYVLLDREAA